MDILHDNAYLFEKESEHFVLSNKKIDKIELEINGFVHFVQTEFLNIDKKVKFEDSLSRILEISISEKIKIMQFLKKKSKTKKSGVFRM